MTLLEKAKVAKRGAGIKNETNRELIELALAYVNGEITCGQAASALGIKPSNVTSRLGGAVLTGIRQRIIEVKLLRDGSV